MMTMRLSEGLWVFEGRIWEERHAGLGHVTVYDVQQ